MIPTYCFYWRSCDFFSAFCTTIHGLYTHSLHALADKSTLACFWQCLRSEKKTPDKKEEKKNPHFFLFLFPLFVLFSWCPLVQASSMRLWSLFLSLLDLIRLGSITVRFIVSPYSSGSRLLDLVRPFVCEQSWWLRFTLSFLSCRD